MAIQKIDDIYELLKGNTQKKRLVVAYANDSHSIEAVNKAVEMGIVEATLCGDENEIRKVCAEHGFDISRFKIVNEPVDTKAAPKATLSHVVVMECPNYHKLLVFSDAAIIPAPDFSQKMAIVKYVTQIANALGVQRPKVAMISATEQVLPKVESTTDAAILAKMGERGQLGNIDIDGPLALDVAIDKEAAEIKKIKSPVAGDADCLVFPSIEAGNVFYKTNTKLANARQGAILVGATAPSVLSSRGDSVDAKLNSIALAALFAK